MFDVYSHGFSAIVEVDRNSGRDLSGFYAGPFDKMNVKRIGVGVVINFHGRLSLLEIPVEKGVQDSSLIRERHDAKVSVSVFRDSAPKTNSPVGLFFPVFPGRHDPLAPFFLALVGFRVDGRRCNYPSQIDMDGRMFGGEHLDSPLRSPRT